jgi:hypothetical protein
MVLRLKSTATKFGTIKLKNILGINYASTSSLQYFSFYMHISPAQPLNETFVLKPEVEAAYNA